MARVLTGFRSGPSRKPVFLRLYNATCKTVNIIWIDYHGRETNYGILEPRSNKNIHSYEGHPWICREVKTKRRYLMNDKELFIPAAIPFEDPNGEGFVSAPINVTIIFPVLSLQDLCIDAIILCLTSEEHILQLNLPTKLGEDILEFWRNANID